jgi:hypothetical protein
VDDVVIRFAAGALVGALGAVLAQFFTLSTNDLYIHLKAAPARRRVRRLQAGYRATERWPYTRLCPDCLGTDIHVRVDLNDVQQCRCLNTDCREVWSVPLPTGPPGGAAP